MNTTNINCFLHPHLMTRLMVLVTQVQWALNEITLHQILLHISTVLVKCLLYQGALRIQGHFLHYQFIAQGHLITAPLSPFPTALKPRKIKWRFLQAIFPYCIVIKIKEWN